MTFNKEIERILDFGYISLAWVGQLTLLHVDHIRAFLFYVGICFHVDFTLASLFCVEDLFFKVFFSFTTIHS